MAAKRVVQSSVNWAALSERVPEQQRSIFSAFKTKSDSYLRAVQQYPDALPKIDWAFYKSRVAVAGMVDSFEKQYTSLQIPYPIDNMQGQLDALDKEIKADIQQFKIESDARIAEYKKQLDHINSLLPFDQMTMEDFRDAYPDEALDSLNRPTFWPHTPEEQPDYVDKHAVDAPKH